VILDQYITAMNSTLDGFSPSAAGFLRFTAPMDESSLPATPSEAQDPSSSVQLIDIDPHSPERGQRKPITVAFRAPPGVYYQPNTLSFMPTLGFPLRPHTRYALVVTRGLRAEDGGWVAPSPDLREMLDLSPPGNPQKARARDALAPAVAELGLAGIGTANIVHLAVFTTSDPVGELFQVRDHVMKNVPKPVALANAWTLGDTTADRDEYRGVYGPSPNYQEGLVPFASFADGGSFRMVDGEPQVFDLFDLRFSLNVPNASQCPMPAQGYPIVLYAHGTGGDYQSYNNDGTAGQLTRRCLAVMGVDQIFHGTRPGAPDPDDTNRISLLFFNVENVNAARTNARQSAIDEVQRARLFTESGFTVPAVISKTGQEIRFDSSRLMFFGHSQGGLNGPLYLAADPSARGGVLSGSAAVMSITLLEKTKPAPSVAALVKSIFLGLKLGEDSELGELHPAISLAQMIVDTVDPIHYARHISISPREGFSAKSIYMTEGINPDGTGDSYSPPHGIEMHALAMGLPLMLPGQRAIEEYRWGGAAPVSIPPEGLSGNLADGTASGALAQWAVPADSDGHFVVFRVPEASDQAANFLRELADAPMGRVPALQ
jgi:predicted esterase